MRLGADRVRVRVPATSANLGPGFDALGIALGVYDEVEVRLVASDSVEVEVSGEGAGQVPVGADHLIVRALRRTLDAVGAPLAGVHLTCANAIPHGRGLGSSAAAAVAGVLAGRALLADPRALNATDVLTLVTEFEGHPDNAAPAILGGGTIAWFDGPERRNPRAARFDVDPRVTATVLIPDTRLATSAARAVLPAEVPHRDAAFNAGRAALLVHALTSAPELLLSATEDRLHQPQRTAVMPGSSELLHSLRAAGFATTISGAGPTVLVLTADDAATAALDVQLADLMPALPGWRTVRPPIDTVGAQAHRVQSA